MPGFGFLVETGDPRPSLYFAGVRRRLAETGILKNPFRGGVRRFSGGLFAIGIKTVYPPVYYFFFFPLLLGVVLGWNWLIMISGFLYFVVGFFWSPLFFMLLSWRGLRKAGYRGKIKILFPGEVLYRVSE